MTAVGFTAAGVAAGSTAAATQSVGLEWGSVFYPAITRDWRCYVGAFDDRCGDSWSWIHSSCRRWNLSNVIPRKDLPRIYTTCLPVTGGGGHNLGRAGLEDMYQTRDEVVGEVMKAPKVSRSINSLSEYTYRRMSFSRRGLNRAAQNDRRGSNDRRQQQDQEQPVRTASWNDRSNALLFSSGSKRQPQHALPINALHALASHARAKPSPPPQRRIDNAITRLSDCISLLLMHAKILEGIKAEYAEISRRMKDELGHMVGLDEEQVKGRFMPLYTKRRRWWRLWRGRSSPRSTPRKY